jgi:prolyl 4-hydroxylase
MSISNSFSILFFIFLYAHSSLAETQPQKPLLVDDTYTCTHPPYKIHIFSTSPLVIYISNFITASERAHLLSITYFTPPLPFASTNPSSL